MGRIVKSDKALKLLVSIRDIDKKLAKLSKIEEKIPIKMRKVAEKASLLQRKIDILIEYIIEREISNDDKN